MKITKAEKIWLAVVILFYICYNLPFVPPYGLAKATLVHALITLVPLWIAIYIGLVKVCRIYRIRDSKTPGDQETSAPESADSNSCSDTESDAAAKAADIHPQTSSASRAHDYRAADTRTSGSTTDTAQSSNTLDNTRSSIAGTTDK